MNIEDILQDWVRGAPDLVVEILSPTTESRDRGIKLKTYARFGVREYWIVDPVAQAIEVYRLTAEGFHFAATCAKGKTIETPLLPGFSLPVARFSNPKLPDLPIDCRTSFPAQFLARRTILMANLRAVNTHIGGGT